MNTVFNQITTKAIFCLFLVIVANVLFYAQTNWGSVAGAFGFLLFSAALFLNKQCLLKPSGKQLALLSLGTTIPLLLAPNTLSYAMYFLGLSTLVIWARRGPIRSAPAYLVQLVLFAMPYGLRFMSDMSRLKKCQRRHSQSNKVTEAFKSWLLPALFSVVFIALFFQANPVMDSWLRNIDLTMLTRLLEPSRFIFCLMAAIIIWPFLRVRLARPIKETPIEASSSTNWISWLFNKKAILRSLILFNALFLIQTSMDLFYLWGGMKLPDGVTYAQYAQKGAYPLMVTTLLAAFFVLVALRSGDKSAFDRYIHALIYVWIAQNILLVISAILRTNLYIAEFSLTYWRFAALVWMGLVAFGLALIIVHLVLKKDGLWLINANVITAVAVLYICNFINIGGIIAQYNTTHCREVTAKGQSIDLYYLETLGISALPAITWLEDKMPPDRQPVATALKMRLSENVKSQQSNWHQWTIQGYWLNLHTK